MLQRSRTLSHVAGGLALLGLIASGCSVPGLDPGPEETVEQLARSLSQGHVEGVDFVDGNAQAAEDHAAVVEDVGDADVEVREVAPTGDNGSAVLSWRRKVGQRTWSYRTGVVLVRDADSGTWQVDWRRDIVEPSLASDEVLETSSVNAPRADILGAGDEPIVTPRPVLRVGLDKAQLAVQEKSGQDDNGRDNDGQGDRARVRAAASELARLVDVSEGPAVRRALAAGPKAFVELIVFRRAEVPERVLAGIGRIPGGRAISDRRPLAPSKDFATALLGTVGPATAELVEASRGRIRPGDDVGLSGLQRRYDEQLTGAPGMTIAAVDADGQRRTLFTTAPRPGTPLQTTLDLDLQGLAKRTLAGVGPASALVAIRPSTGDIVAAASGPGSGGYNTATFGRYPPGSTFKVVTALALLRAGLEPDSPVTCPATTVVDGKRFKNYSDYPASGLGRITLEDALADSCNTAFIGERDRIRDEALEQAAAALGLGVDHDLGFPAYFGQVGADPDPTETQGAASLIGQGTVLASPMAMAAVVASVAQGETVVPRLLPELAKEQGAPKVAPRRPLTPGEARDLRTMMRAVVERGSGAGLADLVGEPVIAKTGTAEFGERPPLPTHAWMVAAQGDLAVAVFVERGTSGSGTAGPLLERFLRDAAVS